MRRTHKKILGALTESPRWPEHRGHGTVWLNDRELIGNEPPWFWKNPDAHPYERRRASRFARERHDRMMARIADRIAAASGHDFDLRRTRTG